MIIATRPQLPTVHLAPARPQKAVSGPVHMRSAYAGPHYSPATVAPLRNDSASLWAAHERINSAKLPLAVYTVEQLIKQPGVFDGPRHEAAETLLHTSLQDQRLALPVILSLLTLRTNAHLPSAVVGLRFAMNYLPRNTARFDSGELRYIGSHITRELQNAPPAVQQRFGSELRQIAVDCHYAAEPPWSRHTAAYEF